MELAEIIAAAARLGDEDRKKLIQALGPEPAAPAEEQVWQAAARIGREVEQHSAGLTRTELLRKFRSIPAGLMAEAWAFLVASNGYRQERRRSAGGREADYLVAAR